MAVPFDESLIAITQYLVGDATMGDTLERVCFAAVDAVQPAMWAGMSMTVDARVGTYVFTDPEVTEIDRMQYDTGHGPCLDAFRSGEAVMIRSMTAAGPYPEFRAQAARHGVNSTLSTPLSTPDERVGALNLYSEHVDAFSDDHIETSRVFADHAAYLLANTKAYWDARMMSENLTEAMRSRAQIEQAKGIIMSAMRCTPDEAFEQLKRQSQHENIKIRELAAEIVSRTSRGQRSD